MAHEHRRRCVIVQAERTSLALTSEGFVVYQAAHHPSERYRSQKPRAVCWQARKLRRRGVPCSASTGCPAVQDVKA